MYRQDPFAVWGEEGAEGPKGKDGGKILSLSELRTSSKLVSALKKVRPFKSFLLES